MSDWYQDVQEFNRQRIPAATVTIIRGSGIGSKMLITAETQSGSLGIAEHDHWAIETARQAIDGGGSTIVAMSDDIDIFIEVFPVASQLIIVGAVHVAQALLPIARSLGFYVIVVDARQQLATRERFPDADQLIVAWPEDAFRELQVKKDAAIAILTHDPKFDEPALLSALATDAMYIGAVGSRSTQADRRDRLRAAGATEEQLARIHGPIGLDIGGKSPEEMALSILAEIVAVRNGRSGRSLAEASGVIRA